MNYIFMEYTRCKNAINFYVDRQGEPLAALIPIPLPDLNDAKISFIGIGHGNKFVIKYKADECPIEYIISFDSYIATKIDIDVVLYRASDGRYFDSETYYEHCNHVVTRG